MQVSPKCPLDVSRFDSAVDCLALGFLAAGIAKGDRIGKIEYALKGGAEKA
jgi:hypothetical protein